MSNETKLVKFFDTEENQNKAIEQIEIHNLFGYTLKEKNKNTAKNLIELTFIRDIDIKISTQLAPLEKIYLENYERIKYLKPICDKYEESIEVSNFMEFEHPNKPNILFLIIFPLLPIYIILWLIYPLRKKSYLKELDRVKRIDYSRWEEKVNELKEKIKKNNDIETQVEKLLNK